jgi:hypothetical protein
VRTCCGKRQLPNMQLAMVFQGTCYVHMLAHTGVDVLRVCACTRPRVCVCVYIYIYVVCVCVCIYIYIYIYIYKCHLHTDFHISTVTGPFTVAARYFCEIFVCVCVCA